MTQTNAGDRKEIRKAEKAARLAQIQERDAVIAIMSTPNGRLWMYHRLEDAHCFNDPFTGDALREAYQKGERNFGLRLLSQLMMYCPDQYIQMTREYNERHNSDNRSPGDEHSGREGTGRDVEGSVEHDYDLYGDDTAGD